MSKRAARKNRAVSSVPMAPMIDMVFLLLVFFMCVSSLTQADSRVEIDLPESTASEVPQDLADRIAISITSEGDAYLAGALLESDADALERLRILSSDAPRVRLRIRADETTSFKHVKRIMRIAAEVGISDIIYATHQEG